MSTSFKMSTRDRGHHMNMESKKSDGKHLEHMSNAMNKAREYIILLLTYFIYKFIRFVVLTFQKFTWAVTGVDRTRKDAKSGLQFKQSAHVQNIFWRRKLVIATVSDPTDFITTHKCFKHPNYVLRPNVSLYCITKDEAVFVEVPEDVNLYQLDNESNVSLFYVQQFEKAHSLITMPLACFHKIAQDLGKPKVPIICISSTGHCGATLLCRVLGQLPGILIINEPDAFTSLAFLNKSNVFGKGEYEQLLPSAMRLQCKTDSAGMILVKTRPCCTSQVPDIYRYFPQMYQLFLYRNNLKTVTSSLNIFSKEPIALVAKYIIDNKILSTILPCFRRTLYYYFCHVLEREKDSSMSKSLSSVGIFTLSWATNISQCLDHVDSRIPLIPILYEDMMKNPKKTCSILFDILDLRQEYIPTALEGFRVNMTTSHQGIHNVAMSDSRKNIPHDFRVEADTLLRKYGLPKLGERFEIPGILDFEANKFNRMNSRDRLF